MRITLAPDSFKGSLTALQVCAAASEGIAQLGLGVECIAVPMADGGEGTVEAMVAATGGRIMSADVFDPLGRPIRAHFGLLGRTSPHLPGAIGLAAAMAESDLPSSGEACQDCTAVVEMAAAAGLSLVPPDKRNPLRATTFGVGQMILAAMDSGAQRIIVGLGGSATVDGGAGCAQAIGVVFHRSGGQPMLTGLGGGGLIEIADLDISGLDPRIGQADIRVACDVTNPMTGPEGAAAVYGPQKGATAEMVAQLDAGLAHFAALIRRKLGVDIESLSGAGAAGGLGGGLVAFAGAKLQRGFDIVASAVGFHRRLGSAGLCITGEGRLDAQTRYGKTTMAVARLAGELAVPCICIPGQATPDAPVDAFASVQPLVTGEITPREAMRHARQFLRRRAAEAMREFLGGK